MKNILLLLLTLNLINGCSQTKLESETPEIFSERIAQSITENDFNKFLVLLVNSSDFDFMIKNGGYTAEQKKQVESTKNERLEILKEQNKVQFATIAPQLSNLTYSKCSFEIEKDVNGIEYIANLKVYMTSVSTGEKVLNFQRLTKTNRGWISIGSFELI